FAEVVAGETRQEFEALIPQLPYIGGGKNRLTKDLIGAVWFLALYTVLKKLDKTVEEVGKIIYESTEAYLSSLSRLSKLGLRFSWRMTFTRVGKKLIKSQAALSQKRQYPEDWVWSFIEGDGKEFDFGMDFIECAVCKFFHSQGADEFTRFVCLTDFPMSKFTGSGLVRTMTLAEGAEKCDFRYKRGREVKQGWPPEFLKSSVSGGVIDTSP
ncbi:L-2-amino-thiazoline-4-carboxylic acid hydrolase, partial [bacterium]|nr:L-2-amino-thiazoline-4-carboxylic acid hydrolase [bacterium]